MDPFVVVIILLSVLAGGGASGAAFAAVRYRRRERMREVLRREHPHDGRSLSLFDVFWDLGTSDLALEMMRHDGLLPATAEDEREAHARLDDLLEAHGSYRAYVDETTDVIEEFQEARRSGDRRNVPALQSRTSKMLDVGSGESAGSLDVDALVATDRSHGRSGELGVHFDAPHARRVDLRESGGASKLRVEHGAGEGSRLIDVDDLGEMSIDDAIGGIVEGRFTETLREWWDGRRIRSLKSDLDDAFEDLYDFYVREAERRADFYDDLFATADRWEEEVDRIEALRARGPLDQTSVARAADLLLEMAAETARSVARRADANTRSAIERIHAFARRGDYAMAGYLVYLNRNAFFAGRSEGYGEYVRRVENLAHRLKQEVRNHA